MLTYKFENSESGHLRVALAGELREDSAMPELSESGDKLIINLNEVTGLNSVGTRLWCRFVADATTKYGEVLVEEAPMLFVKAFSQIQGAINKKCKVVSLKVPYYSESSGENKNVSVKLGEHYFPDRSPTLPEVKDSTGQPMEVDVIEDAYFAFLKA